MIGGRRIERRAAFVAVMLAANLAVVPTAPAQGIPQEIVGGRPASRPYPWMASIRDISGDHFCGGVLVRPQWILTAKHCVGWWPPHGVRIRLGSPSRTSGGEEPPVVQVLWDPDRYSDAAVLKLAAPSELTPIRIGTPAEASHWVPGTEAIAVGWGVDSYVAGSSPDELQEVEIPIVSDTECGISYRGHNAAYEICAGEKLGGRDTCQGDSGGPLMVPDARGRLIVMGTTWKGTGCALPLFYGVYSRAGEGPTHAWIDKTLPPESLLTLDEASGVEGEGDGAIAVRVRRLGITTKTVTVDFRMIEGTATAKADYWPVAGTLTFAPDDAAQTIFVPILGDDVREGDESFEIELSAPVEASIHVGSAKVTIVDDD